MTYYLTTEIYGESGVCNKRQILRNLKSLLKDSYEGCEEEEIIQSIKEAISLVKNNEELNGVCFGAYELTSIYPDTVFTTPNKNYYDRKRVYICDDDVYVVDMCGYVLDHFRRD